MKKMSKKTILAYVIAALVAIQPILMDEVDINSRANMIRFVFRLIVAVLIAIFGKMVADKQQVQELQSTVSSQEKRIVQQETSLRSMSMRISSQSKPIPRPPKT